MSLESTSLVPSPCAPPRGWDLDMRLGESLGTRLCNDTLPGWEIVLGSVGGHMYLSREISNHELKFKVDD